MDIDFFFPSCVITLDCMVVIRVMEYGSMRPYNPIIDVLPYPSAASMGMRFPVPGYLNTSTRYLAQTLFRLDNFTPHIRLSFCSLQRADIALCPMPWLCFSNSSCHVLIDLMKKPVPGSEIWDSKYPMWLQPPRSGRLWRKILWLSQ